MNHRILIPSLLLSLLNWAAAGSAAAPDPLNEAQAMLQAQRIEPDAGKLDWAKGRLVEQVRQSPAQARAWTLLAWAYMTEHRFADALAAARTARAIIPSEPQALALMTDALVELGRYPDALESAQRLLDLEPGMRAWVRAARLRFLHGDLDGAIALMTRAAAAAGPRGEAAAWVLLELARLQLQGAQPEAAAAALAAARRAFPAHPALAPTEARILVARGESQAALDLYRRSLAARPSAEDALVAWRLARALGQEGEARHLAKLLDGLARLDTGGLSRRALAEHFAENDEVRRALELARAELAQRPDIYSHATLARVLAMAGEPVEARQQARAALVLGTPDPELQADMGAILGAAVQAEVGP